MDDLQNLVAKYLQTLPGITLHPGIEHKSSSIAGRGIHACCDIPAGTVLVEETGVIVSQRTIDIVHAAGFECELRVGWGLYSLHRPVHADHQGGYINHSCTPNSALVDIRTFAAVRKIHAGEEITCDYGSFETERGWRMSCSCGAPNCRQTITSEDWMLESMKPLLAPYLRDPTLTKRLRDQYLPLVIDAELDPEADSAIAESTTSAWLAVQRNVAIIQNR